MTLARALLLAGGLLLLAVTSGGAQRVGATDPLKRGLPVAPARPACATPARAATPTAAQRNQARDLAQRGEQAAILGDRVSARDQFRQAAALDPTDSEIAYQLARAYESGGADADALREYCRFLALAPTAPEASEARERVQALTPAARASNSEPALAAFRAGLAAFERGQMLDAEASFSRTIAAEPQWPEPYYDRALARAARGQRELAVRDLQQYLRLRPEADDRAAIVARIATLRGVRALAPSVALARGIVPGGGQFYTGRPVLGVAALAAAGGAVAWALKTDPVTRSVEETATDPFGNTYTFVTTRTEVGRPYVARGAALTAAVVAGAALESYLYARRVNAETRRLSAALVPSAQGLALQVALRR